MKEEPRLPYIPFVEQKLGCGIDRTEVVDVIVMKTKPGQGVPEHTDFKPQSRGGSYSRSMWLGLLVAVFVPLVDHDNDVGDTVLYSQGGVEHSIRVPRGCWYAVDVGYPHGAHNNDSNIDRYILAFTFAKRGGLTKSIHDQLSGK